MSAAAVILLRRKKFIRRFAERGATSPDRALSFADLGMRRSWVFDQSVKSPIPPSTSRPLSSMPDCDPDRRTALCVEFVNLDGAARFGNKATDVHPHGVVAIRGRGR